MQPRHELKPSRPDVMTVHPDLRKLRAFYLGLVIIIAIALIWIWLGTEFDMIAILFTIPIIAPIGIGLFEWRRWLKSSVYTITQEYIEVNARASVFGRYNRRLPIAYIRDITINASQLQERYGLSNLTVSGANGDSITLEDIPNGETIREAIWQRVKPYASR